MFLWYRGLIDFFSLAESCYGRSLSRDKAAIWRMSAERQEANLPARLRNFVGVATISCQLRHQKVPRDAWWSVITECRGGMPPASNPLHKVETTGLLGNAYRSGVNNEPQTRR